MRNRVVLAVALVASLGTLSTGCGSGSFSSSELKENARSGTAERSRRSTEGSFLAHVKEVHHQLAQLKPVVTKFDDGCTKEGRTPLLDPNPPDLPDMSCTLTALSYFSTKSDMKIILCEMSKSKKLFSWTAYQDSSPCEAKPGGRSPFPDLSGSHRGDGSHAEFSWVPSADLDRDEYTPDHDYYGASYSVPPNVSLKGAAQGKGGLFLLKESTVYYACNDTGPKDGQPDKQCGTSVDEVLYSG